jgi:ATP/maltotriose-dependent transcriptional regulator MalT
VYRNELEAALSYRTSHPMLECRVRVDRDGNVTRGEVRLALMMVEYELALINQRPKRALRFQREVRRWREEDGLGPYNQWEQELRRSPILKLALQEGGVSMVFRSAGLSEREAKVITLRLAGWSWNTIGREMGKADSTVRGWWATGLRALQSLAARRE